MIVASARGSRGIRELIQVTTGLMMNARSQAVAEEEEDGCDLVDDDEEEGDDPERQERADQASFARRRPDVERHRRPIRERTSAMVASAIGLSRSAPASRMPSTSSGCAMRAR